MKRNGGETMGGQGGKMGWSCRTKRRNGMHGGREREGKANW